MIRHLAFLVLLLSFSTFPISAERPLKFRGEVKRGNSYEHSIGHGLVFKLEGSDDGWQIEIDPLKPGSCPGYASVVAEPLHGRTPLDLSTDYGTTAQDAASKRTMPPFYFVMTELDCRLENQWREQFTRPYMYTQKEQDEGRQNWGSTAGGRGIFRILDSKVIPGGDGYLGQIEWIKFEVTIIFPPEPR